MSFATPALAGQSRSSGTSAVGLPGFIVGGLDAAGAELGADVVDAAEEIVLDGTDGASKLRGGGFGGEEFELAEDDDFTATGRQRGHQVDEEIHLLLDGERDVGNGLPVFIGAQVLQT